MKPSRVMLILSLCLLPACAPLQPHESAWGDAGEVALRVVACPLTLCTSEMMLRMEHRAEMDRLAYGQWYRTLTPDQQDREDRREAARMQALGFALSGNGPIIPLPAGPVPRAPFLNCTSRPLGSVVYTECP